MTREDYQNEESRVHHEVYRRWTARNGDDDADDALRRPPHARAPDGHRRDAGYNDGRELDAWHDSSPHERRGHLSHDLRARRVQPSSRATSDAGDRLGRFTVARG